MISYRSFVLLALCISIAGSYSKSRHFLRDVYPSWTAKPSRVADDPLILTPYIEAGNIEEAQNLAKVSGGPFFDDIPSFSGFFTVNKDYNSNLFFWYFPAENDYENAPVVLWLQGGPGSSSLFGLFQELGPFSVNDDLTLKKNPYSWHKNHSILFIDNPVGTGFSFTGNDNGYATNETQVGSDLHSAMTQFFTMFPDLQQHQFFIAGESYGGKYVPALAYTIHMRNPTAELKINLQGIAIGNGFSDPVTTLNYASFLYELGLVDFQAQKQMKDLEDQGREYVNNGQYIDAFNVLNQDLNLFYENSDYQNPYNYLHNEEFNLEGSYAAFVQQDSVRPLIHVGALEYSGDFNVYDKLIPDFMVSVKPWVETLIDSDQYRILYYNGMLDVIVGYVLSETYFQTLNFNGQNDYLTAPRDAWHVGQDLAGYKKTVGKFSEMLVRNAGHLVPGDQPVWAADLIYRFTRNTL